MTRPSTPPGFSGGGHGVYGAAGSDVGVRNTISVDHGSLDMYIETGGGATISYYGYNLFSTYGGGFDPNDIAYAGNNQVPRANLEHLFIDLSTTDLHLELSGHRAGNRGLDLSGSFTGDIDGTTRTVTWDIGADEGVTGTAPLHPKIVSWHYDRDLAAAKAALAESEFDADWAEGRGMTFSEAVQYARSWLAGV